MLRHPLLRRTLATLVLLAMACPSDALIVKRWDGAGSPDLLNTTPPPNDPGWANLADNRSGIYLGDGLFLTARHTGVGGTLQFGSGEFPLIPGSEVLLSNPLSFGSRRQTTNSLTSEADLILFRVGLDTTTGLSPEELNPSIQKIQLADSLPATSKDLTMFGVGANRIQNPNNPSDGLWYFSSTGSAITDPAQWPSAPYHGFKFTSAPPPSTWSWQWGQNRRTTSNGGAYSQGSNVLIELGGTQRDTVGFQVRFDENGLTDEAQAAGNDSGGPVFWKDGDDWVLAGLMHGVYAPNNNISLLGAYGAYTAISDLSYSWSVSGESVSYGSQIEGLRGRFSLMGDIDLDGVVTGSVVGGVATGDLGILVDHWLEDSGEADIQSWVRGDLNQDGVTDINDFVLMRDALGGSIAVSELALLTSVLSIPEPGALALLLGGLLAATARRRR